MATIGTVRHNSAVGLILKEKHDKCVAWKKARKHKKKSDAYMAMRTTLAYLCREWDALIIPSNQASGFRLQVTNLLKQTEGLK